LRKRRKYDIKANYHFIPEECMDIVPEGYVSRQEGSEYVLTPLNMSPFFHAKLLLDNSASFTSSRMKDLCQKWKVKLIFRGAYRLSGTGIVECL